MPRQSKLTASVAEAVLSIQDEGHTDDGGQHDTVAQKVRPDDPLVIAAAAGKYVKTSNETLPPSRRTRAHQARGSPPLAEKLAFSIPEFCALHRISTSYYFLLRQRNEAPEELRIGRRILISAEAAAAWRTERTKVSNPKPREL
jgi:hypothetical protein